MEGIEHRVQHVERMVEKIDKSLDQHLIESEAVRAKVNAHEKRIMNGDWKELNGRVTDVQERILRIEERLLSKSAAWKDIAFGVGLLSTVLGMVYIIVRLA